MSLTDSQTRLTHRLSRKGNDTVVQYDYVHNLRHSFGSCGVKPWELSLNSNTFDFNHFDDEEWREVKRKWFLDNTCIEQAMEAHKAQGLSEKLSRCVAFREFAIRPFSEKSQRTVSICD
jgi:hypothetical protein